MMECCDTETLCLHLDRELEPQKQREVAAHLSTCQRCAAQLRALREADARHRSALVRARPMPASGRTCYSAEELSAYASRTLTPQEAQPLEHHLGTCDVCLKEVMAIRRTLSLLQAGELIIPPAHLVAAAQRGFAPAARNATVERLSTLIIQVAREGLRFIEAAFVPEDTQLAVGGHLIPAGAFRGAQTEGDAVALIEIQQSVGDLELRIDALHEAPESVLLRLQTRKRGRPLARRRVALVSGGRTLASSYTSESGEVEFPRLVPGDYTVRLPHEDLETQVILRAL